jgi:hypothetical protein
MPELAKTIRVEDHHVLVNGVELPWYVAAEDIDVTLVPNGEGLASVRLTLLAERVEVDSGLTDRGDDDAGEVTVFESPRDPDLPLNVS